LTFYLLFLIFVQDFPFMGPNIAIGVALVKQPNNTSASFQNLCFLTCNFYFLYLIFDFPFHLLEAWGHTAIA